MGGIRQVSDSVSGLLALCLSGIITAESPTPWIQPHCLAENAGGRQARRPASKVQPIPEARSGAQQRMTRAQASRAAQELLQQANVAVAAAAAAATAGIDGPAPMDTDGSDRGLEGTTPSDGPAEDDHMILLQVLVRIRTA